MQPGQLLEGTPPSKSFIPFGILVFVGVANAVNEWFTYKTGMMMCSFGAALPSCEENGSFRLQ